MYIYHTCVHMLCSHGYKCIHICYAYTTYMYLCIIPISCTHTCRDTLDTYMCILYIHIKLYIHVNVVHMWVYTPMWGTHFHAYAYSITLLQARTWPILTAYTHIHEYVYAHAYLITSCVHCIRMHTHWPCLQACTLKIWFSDDLPILAPNSAAVVTPAPAPRIIPCVASVHWESLANQAWQFLLNGTQMSPLPVDWV